MKGDGGEGRGLKLMSGIDDGDGMGGMEDQNENLLNESGWGWKMMVEKGGDGS